MTLQKSRQDGGKKAAVLLVEIGRAGRQLGHLMIK